MLTNKEKLSILTNKKKYNQSKTQITQQILAESKLNSENNYMLLKNLVGAKITKQFVINLFGTDTPSKTQKSDPKTKEEFH